LYQLTWLGTLGGANSSAFDMNNRGEVVGYAANSNGSSRAFLYTTQTGMVDLNTLADTWVDLGAPEDPAEGWIAKYAYGTNDVGQIVGMARNAAAEARAFLFDPTGESPRFFLLPTLSAGEHRAVAINDFGDIVGYWEDPGVEWRYFLYTAADGQMTDLQTPSPCLDPGHARSNVDINNAGQIVTGTGWRYTPGGEGWRFFANLYPQGINQAGTFVGNAALWKGKNNLYDAAFRFRDPGPAEILLQCSSRISPTAIAFDVNSSGDVCVHGVQSWPDGRRGYLYTDQHGLLRLDDLVTGSPEALARWAGWDITPFAINDRDETGFGQIWGFRYSVSNGVGVYSAFLLTPVRP
jgi:probable HAF family extracellular repeat protein